MTIDNSDHQGAPSAGVGINQLPESFKHSEVLSLNDLEVLAMVTEIPVIDPSFADERLTSIFQYYSINPEEMEKEIHIYAKELLAANKIQAAWQVLLATA